MKIVCLGCSLTAGYGVSREDSWVGILSRTTCDTWINAGICGDTTGGMLARLGESVFSHSPDSALLMGGINEMCIRDSYYGDRNRERQGLGTTCPVTVNR